MKIGKNILITVSLLWFAILVLAPVGGLIVKLAGFDFIEIFRSLGSREARQAFLLTGQITLITVLVNTVMGVLIAMVITRQNFRGKLLLEGLIDLPFAISPVVVGFMIILLYGPYGWIGGWLENSGIKVVYSTPGIALATIFVTLPFVAKEVIPVYKQYGLQGEEAAAVLGASGWQCFWLVTLPSIKWGVIYGVTLTLARALGEFGAVLVVSGSIINKTQTATLFIHQEFTDFNYAGAYAAALVIAALAFTVLIVIESIYKRKI